MPWDNPTNDFLKKNKIYTSLRLDDNYIAFGTIQSGLLISSESGVPILKLNENNGLQNNTILSMYKDSDSNLWLGTDDGIDLVYVNSPFTALNRFMGLSAGYTALMFNGILYLGTNRGVFYKKWTDFENFPQRFENFKVIENTKGQVWKLQVIDNTLFCGHNDGTFIINNNYASKISDVPGVWKFLKPHDDKNIIIAGTYNGFIKFVKENGNWIFEKKIPGFAESSRLIEADKNQTVWMSHGYKGVYKLKFDENFDKVITQKFYNSKNSFKGNFGINVSKIKNEILFFSPYGIFQYDKNTDKIIISEKYSELFSGKNVYFAYEDINKDIWYFSDNNLAVKRLTEEGTYSDIFLPFKAIEGVHIGGFEFVYTFDTNHVLIGYENGFIHYDKNFAKKNYLKTFNAYIRQIKTLKNDSVLFYGNLFNENNDNYSLKYKNNSIQFNFSAVYFDNSEKLLFSSFLSGYYTKWSHWEQNKSREFTNLKEGHYQFYVKAKNIYDAETKPVVYNFYVKPPFTITPFAYLIYILLITAAIRIVYLFSKKRHKKIKEKELLMQAKLHKKREEELQKQTLLAEKELINLRNEKLKHEMKSKDKELADFTMRDIKENKFLYEIKKDLKKVIPETQVLSVKNRVQRIIKNIDNSVDNESTLKEFETHFSNVHEEFLSRLKHNFPEITPA